MFCVAPAAAASAASGSKLSYTRRSFSHNECRPRASQCLATSRKKPGDTWGAGLINDTPKFVTGGGRPNQSMISKLNSCRGAS
jgi:hypothetical protein